MIIFNNILYVIIIKKLVYNPHFHILIFQI